MLDNSKSQREAGMDFPTLEGRSAIVGCYGNINLSV